MNTTETIMQWKSEAGPRQQKQVMKALQRLRGAGYGTLVLSSREDGRESEHIESTFGSEAAKETAHKAEVKEAEAVIFNQFNGYITRANYSQIETLALAAIPALEDSRPVRDERRTPEQIEADKAERLAGGRNGLKRHTKKKRLYGLPRPISAPAIPYLNPKRERATLPTWHGKRAGS